MRLPTFEEDVVVSMGTCNKWTHDQNMAKHEYVAVDIVETVLAHYKLSAPGSEHSSISITSAKSWGSHLRCGYQPSGFREDIRSIGIRDWGTLTTWPNMAKHEHVAVDVVETVLAIPSSAYLAVSTPLFTITSILHNYTTTKSAIQHEP
jgi:hypothetical protein